MFFDCPDRGRRHPWASPACLLACLVLPGALGGPPADSGERAEEQRVLRVAADPNNLPFSNQREEGFENRLAELVARELQARLEYMWWPQRRGFFRETTGAGRADLVMGVPADFERVLPTRPYYRSSYVFVYPRGTRPVQSLDDPRLPNLRIGVQLAGDDFINTPPAHALSRRGLIDNIRGYTLFGDYGEDSPPSAIVRAVARGEIDVAIAWGPMAGYFATRQDVPLELARVTPSRDGAALPMVFAIAMGVRRGDEKLRNEIQAVLDERRREIEAILDEYGVPRLPEEDEPEPANHALAP